MTKFKTPGRLLLLLMAAAALPGCSVISYNRVFPKLDWYWSHDAQVQREEKAQEKAWEMERKP